MKKEKLLKLIIGIVIAVIAIGILPYIIFFGKYYISNKSQDWGAFGDYFSFIINVANLVVVGVLSYFVFILQKDRDNFEIRYIEASERPILIFAVDVKVNKWYVYNVGKGAALNIVIADDDGKEKWQNPMKCYSLASGEKLLITWFTPAYRILGIYSDIFSTHLYSSICKSDETFTEKYDLLNGELPEWINTLKTQAGRLTP